MQTKVKTKMCPSGKKPIESWRRSVIDCSRGGFCRSRVILMRRAKIIIIQIGHDDRRDFSLFFTFSPSFFHITSKKIYSVEIRT